MSRSRLPRPSPAPPPGAGAEGRAGWKAAPSPGSLSGRPSFRPSLSASPTCPRTLFSLSRFPAAVPSLPSSFLAGGGGSPGKRGEWGREAAASLHGLAGPRQGPGLRPAPPRHIHSSERLRGEERRGRERRERRRNRVLRQQSTSSDFQQKSLLQCENKQSITEIMALSRQ